MKINKSLYNNILKSIDRTIKNVLFEYEEYSNKNYVIKEYYKSNQEDFNYVSINRKQIWEFFDNGYKAAGLNGFCNSCFNSDSLRKTVNGNIKSFFSELKGKFLELTFKQLLSYKEGTYSSVLEIISKTTKEKLCHPFTIHLTITKSE